MLFCTNKYKLLFFFGAISFSISVTMAITNVYTHFSAWKIIILGAFLGPPIVLRFFHKKGIYNASVLIVFLLQTALICTSLYTNSTIAQIIASLTLGMSITSSMVMCPIITYYLRGPINFLKILPACILCYFLGLVLFNPLSIISANTITSNSVTLWTIVLLLCSFFTVFSAWRNRFVLLK